MQQEIGGFPGAAVMKAHQLGSVDSGFLLTVLEDGGLSIIRAGVLWSSLGSW